MKQRIFSALVGLVLLFTVFALFDTVVVNIAVSVISVLAINELLLAAGYQSNRKLQATALLFGACIPFFTTRVFADLLPVVCLSFAVVLFCILLHDHETLRGEQLGFTFFFTILISFSFSCFVYLRDVLGTTIGMYAILVTLVGAWMSDVGAYFCGMAFGKHKLAPKISPKKTVEGLIGGIVVSLVSQLVCGIVYVWLMRYFDQTVTIRYLPLLLLSPGVSLLSVLGDLSASALKRQFGLKDFGAIMPGHGGVLDRFDSVLLALPFVYILFRYLPLIEVLH